MQEPVSGQERVREGRGVSLIDPYFVDETNHCFSFGLARATDDIYVSSSKQAAIPVRWASPEQLGQGKTSLKSDCYSFGVTTWELLSDGALPFAGMANAEVQRVVMAGETAKELLPPPCAEGLFEFDSVVVPCWSVEPDDRPNMKQVRQLLERALPDAQRSFLVEPVTTYEDDYQTMEPNVYSKSPALPADNSPAEDSNSESSDALSS
jgi:Protein tyrosine and serine/threonine kinase